MALEAKSVALKSRATTNWKEHITKWLPMPTRSLGLFLKQPHCFQAKFYILFSLYLYYACWRVYCSNAPDFLCSTHSKIRHECTHTHAHTKRNLNLVVCVPYRLVHGQLSYKCCSNVHGSLYWSLRMHNTNFSRQQQSHLSRILISIRNGGQSTVILGSTFVCVG